MKVDYLLEIAKETFDDCMQTLKDKNHDYSPSQDAMHNFKTVEFFKLTTSTKGILVRIYDKISRITNILNKKEIKVKDESLEDSINDCINYLVLMKASLREGKNDRSM